MKVNVIQVEDAKFQKWAWWSNWVDVSVFDYSSTPFLLQMRVNRFNKKQFNAMRMTGKYIYRQSSAREIGDLTQMSESA